jgi:hypothetical protein
MRFLRAPVLFELTRDFVLEARFLPVHTRPPSAGRGSHPDRDPLAFVNGALWVARLGARRLAERSSPSATARCSIGVVGSPCVKGCRGLGPKHAGSCLPIWTRRASCSQPLRFCTARQLRSEKMRGAAGSCLIPASPFVFADSDSNMTNPTISSSSQYPPSTNVKSCASISSVSSRRSQCQR